MYVCENELDLVSVNTRKSCADEQNPVPNSRERINFRKE